MKFVKTGTGASISTPQVKAGYVASAGGFRWYCQIGSRILKRGTVPTAEKAEKAIIVEMQAAAQGKPERGEKWQGNTTRIVQRIISQR